MLAKGGFGLGEVLLMRLGGGFDLLCRLAAIGFLKPCARLFERPVQRGLSQAALETLALALECKGLTEERDALLEFLPTIDSSRFTVIEMPFVNRPNCPPIPVLILKDR